MDPCDEEVEGQGRERAEYSLHKRLTASTMLVGRAVQAVEQLRGGDRSYRDLIVCPQAILQTVADSLHCAIGGQRARRPLELDEDRSV
jgi:hypothetical protein